MGNRNIRGQCASEVLQILVDEIKGESKIFLDYDKLREIAKAEIKHYDEWVIITQEREKAPNERPSKFTTKTEYVTACKQYYDLLYAYTGHKDHVYKPATLEELDKADEEAKAEPFPKYSEDLTRLHLVYGRKQCEYAISLIDRAIERQKANGKDDDIKPNMREIFASEIKAYFDSQKATPTKDAAASEQTVLQKVQPYLDIFERSMNLSKTNDKLMPYIKEIFAAEADTYLEQLRVDTVYELKPCTRAVNEWTTELLMADDKEH